MRRHSTRSTRHALAAALTVLALGSFASAGCYRKVVGTRGLGTGTTPVHERSDPSFLDRLLGPEPEPARAGTRMRVN